MLTASLNRINVKNQKGQYKMDNSEKLATVGTKTQSKDKQNNNTTYVGHHYTQTNTNNVNTT